MDFNTFVCMSCVGIHREYASSQRESALRLSHPELGPHFSSRVDACEPCPDLAPPCCRFQHKCKSISMSKWTAEEVKKVESGGNLKAEQ
eukprot:1372886-Rhodomonas_salina.1